MPENNPIEELSDADYRKLKSDLVKLLTRTEETKSAAHNDVCSQAYWQMGARLNTVKALTQKTVSRLSDDLKQSRSFFYRLTQFHKAWPRKLDTHARTLSWSKHIELLAVSDPVRRKFYLQTCLEKNLSRDGLRRAIRKDYYALVQSGQALIDELEPDTQPYNVYKAIVERVLDGDTLELRIDLGFRNWTTQIVRLRGINTAELDSLPESAAHAEQAKAYLTERLKDQAFVTIKTHKTDIYGRYIADVFYSPPNESKPRYLNRELLQSGLAEVMM